MRKLQMLLVQRILRMRYYNGMPQAWEDLFRKYGRRVFDRQLLKYELRCLPSDRFPPNNPNDEISWLELDADGDDDNDGGNNTQTSSATSPRSLAKAEETEIGRAHV